jgi:ribokinase
MSLSVIGNAVVDIIFPDTERLATWPGHTEFTSENLVLLEQPPIVTVGGNGANAAYVAARCGARVTLHSNLGSDTFGAMVRSWLTEVGCTLPPAKGSRRTPVNVTVANTDLQRATYFYPGASAELPPPDPELSTVLITGWPHPLPQPTVVSLQRYRAAGIRTALDIGPFLEEPPSWQALQPVFAELDCLIANFYELTTLTQTASATDACDRIRKSFRGDIVLKRGADGVVWCPAGSQELQQIAGIPTEAVNTVGAGDTFNGALLAYLDAGTPIETALTLANTAAASVVGSIHGVLGLQVPSTED